MDISRIKDLRKDYGYTQNDIIKLLNYPMDQKLYSHYETGKRKIPLEVLEELSILYKTSIDYLLNLTDTRKPYPRKK